MLEPGWPWAFDHTRNSDQDQNRSHSHLGTDLSAGDKGVPRDIRRTVLGAHHNMATGTRRHRLRPMLESPAAPEIAKVQDENPSFEFLTASGALI